MAIQIQTRRDTAANWTANDPTLAEGELGFETDTNKTKFGDGATAWTGLSYQPSGTGDVTAADNMTDNTLLRGDGGAKGIQDTGITIDDSDNITIPTNLSIGYQETSETIAGLPVGISLYNGIEGDSDLAGTWLDRHTDTPSFGAHIVLGRSRGITHATSSVVQDGDLLGGIFGVGFDGIDYALSSKIALIVDDATPGVTDMGGAIIFETANEGTENLTERMRIDSAGLINIPGTLNVVGNITTTGTFDGRDVALDGSKLDNIASGAQVNNISDVNATALTDGGDTTLHDHDGISENTSARHTQGTDTTLGSGAVSADHGIASSAMIVNVCYGTSETPPTASTTTEGTLYVQYTA